MTYVFKAGKFGVIKVADLFGSLKNVTSGAYTNVLAGGGRFDINGTYIKNTDVPVVKGNYIEWPGGSRLNLDDGKVYKPDGTVSAAKVELSADDIARLKSSLPHAGETIPAGVKEPVLAGAHDPVRTPGGTAHDLGPSASHETPGGPSHNPYRRLTTPCRRRTTSPVREVRDRTATSSPVVTAAVRTRASPGRPEARVRVVATPEVRPAPAVRIFPDGPGEPRGNLPDGSWEGPQGLRLDPHATRRPTSSCTGPSRPSRASPTR